MEANERLIEENTRLSAECDRLSIQNELLKAVLLCHTNNTYQN
jgi:hypothetical protein